MPLSLHAATIPTMLQLLGAGQGWLDKAEASGMPEPDIAGACLTEGMFPFAHQVKSMATHSMGAIEGLRAGVFSPDMGEVPATLAAMRAKLAEAENFLQALEPEELEGFIGQPMHFQFKDFRVPFAGEDFLLSFSQPNFFFHATTAYAILRAHKVDVGKLDYLGAMRRSEG